MNNIEKQISKIVKEKLEINQEALTTAELLVEKVRSGEIVEFLIVTSVDDKVGIRCGMPILKAVACLEVAKSIVLEDMYRLDDKEEDDKLTDGFTYEDGTDIPDDDDNEGDDDDI